MDNSKSIDETQETPAVFCKQMSFSYKNSCVLKDISFSLPRGQSLAMVGPNGGGKSTLLSLLVGLLTPSFGKVELFGKAPLKSSRKTASLFQHRKDYKDFPITIQEVVLMGLYGEPVTAKEKKNRVEEALKQLKLEDLANKRLNELSGGQIQKTFLARTWISDCDIYFFDEPTSFLDETAENLFYKKILQLKKEGKATVIISHDLSALPVFADYLLCVNKSVHFLDKEELKNEELKMKTLQELYNSPYIKINPHSHDHGVLKS